MAYDIAPVPVAAANTTQYLGDTVLWNGTKFVGTTKAQIGNPDTWSTFTSAPNTVIDSVPKLVYGFDPATSGGAMTFDPTATSVSCAFYIVKKQLTANAAHTITLKINGATVANYRVASAAAANTDYVLLGSTATTDAAAKAWLVIVDVPNKWIYVINSA